MAFEIGTIPDQFLNATMSQLADISIAEASATLKPVALFVVGIVLYGVFVFQFYKFLAKRDIVSMNLNQYTQGLGGFIHRFLQVFAYFLETIVVMPALIFFWFVVLAAFLLVLGKNQAPGAILVTAAALVAGVRVTSYYNEDLSRDLAKMIPFGLLGVFLIDATYFSLDDVWNRISQLFSLWKTLVVYLFFVVAIEFVMRILNAIKDGFKLSKN